MKFCQPWSENLKMGSDFTSGFVELRKTITLKLRRSFYSFNWGFFSLPYHRICKTWSSTSIWDEAAHDSGWTGWSGWGPATSGFHKLVPKDLFSSWTDLWKLERLENRSEGAARRPTERKQTLGASWGSMQTFLFKGGIRESQNKNFVKTQTKL
jgi:hypothetical protein